MRTAIAVTAIVVVAGLLVATIVLGGCLAGAKRALKVPRRPTQGLLVADPSAAAFTTSTPATLSASSRAATTTGSISDAIRFVREQQFPETLAARVTVVTYADAAMARSKAILLRELQPYLDADLVQSVHAYGPEDLYRDPAYPSKEFLVDYITDVSKKQRLRRGGGYWIWKPYVVNKALHEASNATDIVVYMDAGCAMEPVAAGFLPWLKTLAVALKQDILPVQIPEDHYVGRWTKRSVLDMFGITDAHPTFQRRQFAATHMWIRNTPLSRRITQEWASIAATKPAAFMDLLPPHETAEQQYPCFTEARHDQSVWTLLLYKHLPIDTPKNVRAPFIALSNDPFEKYTTFRINYLLFARRRLR